MSSAFDAIDRLSFLEFVALLAAIAFFALALYLTYRAFRPASARSSTAEPRVPREMPVRARPRATSSDEERTSMRLYPTTGRESISVPNRPPGGRS